VKSARITDRLFGVLKGLSLQKPVPSDLELPRLEDIIDSDAASEMTASEIESVKVNLNLLKVVCYLGGSKSVSSHQAEDCLAEVQDWLESKTKEVAMDDAKISSLASQTGIFLRPDAPIAPTWKTFHALYVALESLKAVASISSIALKKGSKSAKLPKERVERLVNSANQLTESIRANSRVFKSRLSESGVLGALVDLVVAGVGHGEDGPQLRAELDKIFDMSALEMFCGELMESWEEALGGVLGVRL
jgi:N-terminal acetyltransferase B complex non-catalytic subunit